MSQTQLATLDGTGKVPVEQIPALTAQGAGTAATHAATDFDTAGSASSAQNAAQAYTDQLAATLPGKYRPLAAPPTLMGMGDSITANGGALYSSAAGTADFFYASASWHLWAVLQSAARFLHIGNAATAGYTIQQIKATHLPTVLAVRPTYCVVLAGQNNGAVTPQDLADLASIYTSLQAAGIIPILCTNVPSNTSTANFRLNQWVTRYAARNGLPLLDLYSVLVDPATGLYKAGWSGDGTHPNEIGAKAMGAALATLMQGLIPASSGATFAAANIGQTTLVANPLFLNDNGQGTPIPTGWSAKTTVAAGASSFSTPGGTVGRLWTINRPTGVDNFVSSGSFVPNPGDTILTAMRIGSSAKSVGGTVELHLWDSKGNGRFTLSLKEDIPAGSALAWLWKVPAGLPDYTFSYQVRASGADNTTLSVSQFTAVNLTAVGADA